MERLGRHTAMAMARDGGQQQQQQIEPTRRLQIRMKYYRRAIAMFSGASSECVSSVYSVSPAKRR